MTVIFGPVGPEVLIIMGIFVLLFGASKIPKLARATGQSLGEFKKGRKEIEKELEEAKPESVEELEDVSEEIKEEKKNVAEDIKNEGQELADTVNEE